MRIFIITMDEPIETHQFIRYILHRKGSQVVGLAVTEGGRLSIGKNRSRAAYLLSLFLIMGPGYFLANAFTALRFAALKKAHILGLAADPSIRSFAAQLGIPTWRIKTPNSRSFREELQRLGVDVVINQSQNILKKALLDIPRIGVINRHNALLPRNRGRLTPFWALYKGERESGVSIHFVTEGIDAGPVIVQKKFDIAPNETFRSLVRKNYEIAPLAMVEALEKLESGAEGFLPNRDEEATYNSVPTLRDAWRFRARMIRRWLSPGYNQL